MSLTLRQDRIEVGPQYERRVTTLERHEGEITLKQSSAEVTYMTKLFRSMPEPDWLTLDMMSLPVVVVPDVELPVLAT